MRRPFPSSAPRGPARTVAALALALFASGCGAGADPGPNLLLVVFDTTRADHLSCYGHRRPTTPAVDALAERGVRFPDTYAHSSLTPVSAGSLLSGVLPFRHGVRSLFIVAERSMNPDVPSLFELVRRSGRRTAGFVSALPMGRQYGLARGFDVYEDDMEATKERNGLGGWADAPQRPADDTTELALEWLDENADEPFGVLVHYFDAHDVSFLPPADFLAERMPDPLPPNVERATKDPRVAGWFHQDLRRLRTTYDVEIAWMDVQLARILERLEAKGALDDTIVVVVADHGEAFGEHGVMTHGWLYEEQLRVPLVLAGPGVPRGRVIDARARLVDVLPTLAELLDLPAPKAELDGESLVPLFDGRPTGGAPRPVYAEVHHADDDARGREPEMYTLVWDGWKYVHRPAGEHELFDLASDPREERNLYDPAHPKARAMSFSLQSMGAITGGGASIEGIPPEELEKLRALGYL